MGHVISADGILPDPEKIIAVSNYPVPKDAKETKRFVAFANYYRKFIKNFAEIASPLNMLSKKNVNFDWTRQCQEAFEKLKNALINPPVLQYPDLSEDNTFCLRTDASGNAVGAVLSNKDDKPVAYASRALNNAEKRYCTIEKELLAIVWAVKKFRHYLLGRTFKILTDHRPLIYLFNMTNPSSRLTKFRLALEEFDFIVEYVKGVDNVTADALSRIEIKSDELKNMNTHEICIMTRAQTKKQRMIKQTEIEAKKFDDDGIDHPGIVELIKAPNDYVLYY